MATAIEAAGTGDDYFAHEKPVPPAAWLHQLYEHMPDAVFAITANHTISACNSAAQALFGYEESELLGRKIDFVWSPTPAIPLRGRWADRGAVRSGVAMTKSGTRFPTALTIIREGSGGEAFAAAIFEDFRSEDETLQQVRELQGELARLARTVALGEMTPALAHELAQPLSSILAYSQGCGRLMANDGRKFDEIRGALSEITQHALRAGTIIRSIHELARRGAGEKKPQAMHDLIRDAAALALAGSDRKELQIGFEFQGDRDTVLADRVQITQVLINLIRNAVEATDGVEQPRIIVSTRTGDGSRLVTEVADNGCGIAAGIEAALFRPFVTSKPRGLGMGLALSKRIVEAHGGRIAASNGARGGSVLSFSLPLEINTNGKRPDDPPRR